MHQKRNFSLLDKKNQSITNFLCKRNKPNTADQSADFLLSENDPPSNEPVRMHNPIQETQSACLQLSKNDTSSDETVLLQIPVQERQSAHFQLSENDPAHYQLSENDPSSDESVMSGQPSNMENDIGIYNLDKLNDEQRYFLAMKHYVPPASYDFPFTEKKSRNRVEKLRASHDHLKCFEWLVYSDVKKGYFCLPCALFLNKSVVKGKVGCISVGKLVTEPIVKFSKIRENLNKHAANKYHKEQEIVLRDFKRNFKMPSRNIVNTLKRGQQRKAKENREALSVIIDALKFCGAQNIPIRGHRDSGELIEKNENQGNFRELLLFRQKATGETLESLSVSGTAFYISPQIQNELISIIGMEIQRKIIEPILRKNLPYAIIFDETPDIAKKEQMSVVIRFIDEFSIKEKFIGFYDCFAEAKSFIKDFDGSLTGSAIGNIVTGILNRLNLPIRNLVSISTDTASVMASQEKGAVAKIKLSAPHAIHSPCLNHILNLSLKGTCQMPSVQLIMDVVDEVYNFFRYPKRATVLEKFANRASGLQRVVLTRWTSAMAATTGLKNQLKPILKALQEIKQWTDFNASKEASLLLIKLRNSEYIINLFITNALLEMIIPLTNLLQSPKLNLSKAYQEIERLISKLKHAKDSRAYFSKLFEEGEKAILECDLNLKYNRCGDRQSVQSEYKTNFDAILDYFIQDLESRTGKREKNFLCVQEVLDNGYSTEKIDKIFESYSPILTDMSRDVFHSNMRAELEIWCELTKDSEDNLKASSDLSDQLPLTTKLVAISQTNPVSVASAERSFSALKRIKTWLRNKTGQNRLNGLALMNMNRGDIPTNEEIIDLFSSKARKFDFIL